MKRPLFWFLVCLPLPIALLLGMFKFQPGFSQAQASGRTIAQLKNFAPGIHGFRFQNYGNRELSDSNVYSPDFFIEDLQSMFGRTSVCRNGNQNPCVLNAGARVWLARQLEAMDYGHCEGMAVSSLLFWQGYDFNGKRSPAAFQPNAQSAYDLNLTPALSNQIARFFMLQSLHELADPTARIRQGSPTEILRTLIEGMQSGQDPYTMGIYRSEGNGKQAHLTAGHTLLPYAVVDKGKGRYWVYVYDSNYPVQPGQPPSLNQVVEFNTNPGQDWWRYQPRPSAPPYWGNANQRTLDLTRLSLRTRTTPYTCPFCQQQTQATIFSLLGEGYLLVRNTSQGITVGYDPNLRQHVDTSSEAAVIPFKGGLGKNISPTYRIPAAADLNNYNVLITGKPNQPVDADLVIATRGFTLGMDRIRLKPGEKLGFDLNYSYKVNRLILEFQSTQANAAIPEIHLALDHASATDSYIINLGSINLGSAKSVVVLNLDLSVGLLTVIDANHMPFKYPLKVTRISPSGEVTEFEPTGGTLRLSGKSQTQVSFKKTQLTYSIDGGVEIPLRSGRKGSGN